MIVYVINWIQRKGSMKFPREMHEYEEEKKSVEKKK